MGRTVALYAAAVVFIWLFGTLVYVGLTALLDRTVHFALSLQPMITPVGVLSVLFGMRIRNLHWVRLSAAGVEIGTTRTRAVLVPWSDVESATVRGRSILANVDIVPYPAATVALQNAKGQLSPTRTRGGRRGYPVQVGLFRGGPGAVAAALRDRGVP
ncbi:hypothetical protein [Dactylosporangium salmoneum]|uniref:hypothetical protein n=1 Tax=Dactylosporangium salmoneum TaxID=53361 RepID=UPI0031DFCCC7